MGMKYLPIHILRSQCDEHKLDTMRTFVLKDGENPTKAFEQMEDWVKARWPREHGCTHRIKFTWSSDKQYHWNSKLKKAVRK